MSELFSDEFLSAYLDGELSPHERAAVERWIERAPEARQRLEDFRGLSRLFGDLPRTELPREFATEVMHLAERRMLLPDAASAGGRKRIRGWTLVLAATTAAAGLLLTLTVLNVDDHRAPGVPVVARNNPGAPPADFAPPATRAVQKEQTGVQLAQDEGPSRPGDQPRGGALSPASAPAGVAARVPTEAALPAGAVTAKSEVSEGSHSGTVDSDQQLKAISVAVQEVRESGTAHKYVLVVRAHAVDRADGLVLLQNDFAANNIRVDARDAEESKAATGDRRVADKPSANGPFAEGHRFADGKKGEANSEGLYVEAEADAVIAAFKTTLARRHPGVQFTVEPAIELAALDPELQRNLFRSSLEKSQSDVGRGDDAAKAKDGDAKSDKKSPQSVASQRKTPMPNARTSPGLGPQKTERSARVPPPGSGDSDADEKDAPAGPDRSQSTGNARQIVVSNLPPAIQNRARSSGKANPTDEKSLDEKSGDARPSSPAPKELDERSPVLVRMLIVIDSEPQRPAVPAVKKEPSGGAS